MGEIADLLLSGLLDEETGDLIGGEAPGYPRSPQREARERDKRSIAKATGVEERPYACRQCGRRFATAQAKEQHRQAKHT